MLFHAIEDKQVIIRNIKTGIYNQAKLYERKGEIYAGIGGGFIRLLEGGRSSHPNVKWDDIEIAFVKPVGINGGIRTRPAVALAA